MTIRHQIELETISLALLAAFFGGFFVWRSNQNFQQKFRAATPIIVEDNVPKIVVPTLNPILRVETASQISPDGTKKLTMRKVDNTDGTFSYSFTTSDSSGNNPQQIYNTKVDQTKTFSIPYNTWSPDNKYIFIVENGNGALVFKANGEPIEKGQTYLDVLDLFNNKIKEHSISEVTGWASETLLIANTIKQDNTKGPSYWFEVPSKAIIQLSSQF